MVGIAKVVGVGWSRDSLDVTSMTPTVSIHPHFKVPLEIEKKTFSAAESSISGTNYPNGYEAPYQSMILRTNSTISAVIWKIKRQQFNY